jgi:hypothetical protein
MPPQKSSTVLDKAGQSTYNQQHQIMKALTMVEKMIAAH